MPPETASHQIIACFSISSRENFICVTVVLLDALIINELRNKILGCNTKNKGRALVVMKM